jgi:endonuclease/exonuclease/phosphatase family metal-dependent hydrolase
MREKILEIVFILFSVMFALSGYGIPQFGPDNYELVTRRPGEFRMVTWNVGGAGGYGGRSLEDKYVPHIAAALKKLDADLILLQEVASAGQLRHLTRLMGGQWNIRTSSGAGSLLAILGRDGKLQSRSQLERSHGSLAALYYLAGFRSFLVMNIHANPYSARERNTLLGGTTNALMSEDSGYLKILAGDLNLDIDLDKRRDLFSDNEHLDVETYNYIAQHIPDITRDTGSTAEPDRRLDYIFADTGRLEVIRAGPWKGQRVADMDHDPVVADLKIKDRQ